MDIENHSICNGACYATGMAAPGLARIEEVMRQASVLDVFQGIAHLFRYLPGTETAVRIAAPVPISYLELKNMLRSFRRYIRIKTTKRGESNVSYY